MGSAFHPTVASSIASSSVRQPMVAANPSIKNAGGIAPAKPMAAVTGKSTASPVHLSAVPQVGNQHSQGAKLTNNSGQHIQNPEMRNAAVPHVHMGLS
jgi:hypothetical protein